MSLEFIFFDYISSNFVKCIYIYIYHSKYLVRTLELTSYNFSWYSHILDFQVSYSIQFTIFAPKAIIMHFFTTNTFWYKMVFLKNLGLWPSRFMRCVLGEMLKISVRRLRILAQEGQCMTIFTRPRIVLYLA